MAETPEEPRDQTPGRSRAGDPRQRLNDDRDVPYYYRRPRSRHRWIDAIFEGWFTFVGPGQGTVDRTPQRGPRTAEEAAAGYGEWDRVTTPDGKTFLVRRRDDPAQQ